MVNMLPQDLRSLSINMLQTDLFALLRFDDPVHIPLFNTAGPNRYRDLIKSLIERNGAAYWAIFPAVLENDDFFAVFTVWQKIRGEWFITAIDIGCQ